MRNGRGLAVLGVFILSFDALLVRLVDSSPANVLFWRGLLVFISLTLAACLNRQWQAFLRDTPWRDASLIMLLYAISQSLFVLAISHTAVANAVVILSCSPLFSAIFSRYLLGEALPWHTALAIAGALTGVVIVFAGELSLTLNVGDIYALLLAASIGLALTLLRKHPLLPRMPILAGSGLMTAAFALPWAMPFALEVTQYAWLSVMGLVQMPLASLLLMLSTRQLASAEVSLYLMIETVMGPLWVWWIMGEQPPGSALLGGLFILGSIALLNAYLLLRPPAQGSASRG